MTPPTVIAFAAIGIALPRSGMANAPTATSQVDTGSALARLTYPARMDEVAMTYAFMSNVAATYHADPKLHALDRKHPGLVDAMVAALLQEYRQARNAALPRLWTKNRFRLCNTA